MTVDPPDAPRTRRSTPPARWLRSLAGVDEQALDWVAHERARYTAVGGVVLGTALIAGFSMYNFLEEIVGSRHTVALIPAAGWFFFILNLDRWLVSSQIGGLRNSGVLVMRLVVAVLFGVLIAEPLVLRVFQPAIEQRAVENRNKDLDTLRANLERCNPKTATDAPAPAHCGGLVLTFPASPTVIASQLRSVRADGTSLRRTIDQDSKAYDELKTRTANECKNLVRMAKTGLYARTSECERYRELIKEFDSDHQLAANQRAYKTLTAQIATLEKQLAAAKAGYLAARNAAIEKRVRALTDTQTEIGLIERMSSLEEFSRQDRLLLIAIWLVRLFFVVVDCLPILVKFFGGKSAYDRIVSNQTETQTTLHRDQLQGLQQSSTQSLEKSRARNEAELKELRSDLDLQWKAHLADRQMKLSVATEELALSRISEARSRRMRRPHSVRPDEEGEVTA